MKKNKIMTGYLLFILEGLPLFIYPFVLLANLMSLAGEESSHENLLLGIVVKVFILLTTTYPVTYIVCLLSFIRYKTIMKSLIPIVHLILCILFLYLWSAIEN